jgi:hypothetical protein
MEPRIEWHTASPLWDLSLADPGPPRERFKAPALLRFASDAFMDELQSLLVSEPAQLAGQVARQESWRAESAGWLGAQDPELGTPIKLYQPAHSRFYLVAISLNCRSAGLPERRVDAAREEQAGFLMRRLIAGDEYAWIGDRQQGRWQRLSNPMVPAGGEERLALFPVRFELEGRVRYLYTGLIPVASREVYEDGGAAFQPVPSDDELDDDPLGDTRIALFRAQILAGLQALADPPSDFGTTQAREALAFVLLDLAEFLQNELVRVWQALVDNSDSGLSIAERALYDELIAQPSAQRSWRHLMLDIEDHRQAVLTQTFADIEPSLLVHGLSVTDVSEAASDQATPSTDPPLLSLITGALPEPPADPVPQDPGLESPPVVDTGPSTYVIRCVHERPRCGGFVPPLVSYASRPFQLASFFDPDAPVRRNRIRMPVDTSLKGLRQSPKGLSIQLSKELRRQMDRAQKAGMGGLIDGDSKSSSLDLGVVCSFSIPIITICALILLMIIVQLLNIVFFWLPYFHICLPVRR